MQNSVHTRKVMITTCPFKVAGSDLIIQLPYFYLVRSIVLFLFSLIAMESKAQKDLDSLDQKIAHFNASASVWRYQMSGTYGSPFGNLDVKNQLQMDQRYYGVELDAQVDFGGGQAIQFIYLIQTSSGVKELKTLNPRLKWVPYSFDTFRDVTISANIENTLFGIIYQNKILWKPNMKLVYRGGLYRVNSTLTMSLEGILIDEQDQSEEEGSAYFSIANPNIFPVVGLGYTWDNHGRFYTDLFAEGIYIKMPSLSGAAFHGGAGLNYMFWKKTSVGIFYRIFYTDLEVPNTDPNLPPKKTQLSLSGLNIKVRHWF